MLILHNQTFVWSWHQEIITIYDALALPLVLLVEGIHPLEFGHSRTPNCGG